MGILKQPGSNAVGVAKAVRAAIANLQKTLPPGMKLEVLFDTTGFIEESVNEIGLELGLAVVLTALVCWLFLGSLSSTMNVLFAIPMSLLGTIAILYFGGFTLNTFTLLGLSLAVGLVVDDAVMVMENIFRHAEMGKDRVTAAGEGTKEITFAALAATIAVIAIFMPVAFMSGVIGKFFLQFGVTLSVAVAISYVEAITLAPARCAQMLRRRRTRRAASSGAWPTAASTRSRAATVARSSVRSSVPWVVLVIGDRSCSAAAGFTATRLQQEFVPSQDQSRLSVRLTTAVGADARRDRRATRAGPRSSSAAGPRSSTRTDERERRQRRSIIADAGPAERAQADAGAVLGGHPQGAQRRTPGCAPSVQDLSQQGFGGQQGLPRRVLRARQRLGHARRRSRTKLEGGAARRRASSTDVDSDYQLGAPELMIAPDRAARHRPRRLGQRHREHRQRARRRRRRRPVLRRRPPHGHARAPASRRSASRPEDLSASACATSTTRTRSCRCRRSSSRRSRPSCSRSTTPTASARSRITGNVAPGHSQGEALAYVADARDRARRPATASCSAGRARSSATR